MDIKFPIRPVLIGNRLIKYEYNNDNSVVAIRAVNFRLPISMQKNWIVDIPLRTTSKAGFPAFYGEP
jgi:hypothetical protein